MVLDCNSVGSEESFTMLNVSAEPAVTQQEQHFPIGTASASFVLWHHGSGSTTGAIVRMFPDKQQKMKVSKAVRTLQDTMQKILNNTGVLQSVRVYTDKTDANADTWEAAIRHFGKVGVSSCFLMEIDKGCLQRSVFDDSVFGKYIGSLVKNAVGIWEPAVKTNVSQNRFRVFRKSPWWDLSCDDDVWLHEQATTNRAQNSFVDEQLEEVQSAHDNDDNSNDDSIRALCEQQAIQGGCFLLNLRNCPKEQDSTWDTSLGLGTNLPGLIRSFAETGEDLHLHFDSAKRVAEAAVESAIARFQRTGSARRWDGTFFTTWSTPLIGTLAKVDRKKAEQINQEL